MNFCVKCGGKMNETGDVCTNCGIRYGMPEIPRVNTAAKTNGMAIAGMLTGLISLVFSMWGLVSVLAIIFSSVARRQISEFEERGDGMAITGLCCGIISLAFMIFVWTIQGFLA